MIKRVLEILGIVFITLKIVGVINWPWVIVLLPFLIPFGIVVLLLIVLGIVTFLAIQNEKT